MFFSADEPLSKWKDHIQQVVNSINFTKSMPRDQLNYLTNFFCRKTVLLPPMEKFFKFKIGDQVIANLSNTERRSMGFKYSLHPGK